MERVGPLCVTWATVERVGPLCVTWATVERVGPLCVTRVVSVEHWPVEQRRHRVQRRERHPVVVVAAELALRHDDHRAQQLVRAKLRLLDGARESSETLGRSSRVPRAAPSLQMQPEEPTVAGRGPTKTAPLWPS